MLTFEGDEMKHVLDSVRVNYTQTEVPLSKGIEELRIGFAAKTQLKEEGG